MSTIGFLPDSEIQIYNNNNPNISPSSSTNTTNTGLRWRLDTGPTHLYTVTFQEVSTNDGAIIPCKGFIDVDTILESRYSKLPMVTRSAVSFLMRGTTSSGSSKLHSITFHLMDCFLLSKKLISYFLLVQVASMLIFEARS